MCQNMLSDMKWNLIKCHRKNFWMDWSLFEKLDYEMIIYHIDRKQYNIAFLEYSIFKLGRWISRSYDFTVKQFCSHERENNICKLLYVLYITRKETRFRHKNKNSCWYNMFLVIMDIQETGTFIFEFFLLKKTKIKDKILSEMCDRDKYCTFCYLFWKNI